MVEHRPLLDFICHLILIAGVAIVAFPVYIALIASTHGPNDFLSGLIPLTPGPYTVDNYVQMLETGVSTSGVHWLNGRLNKWVERVRVCGSQALQATGLRRDGQQAIGFVSA